MNLLQLMQSQPKQIEIVDLSSSEDSNMIPVQSGHTRNALVPPKAPIAQIVTSPVQHQHQT